ncbi:hypothetical protein [Caulobacter soli]|uniref:hypothetical protein n=1 Tax=Caulobacter soli TaxID=2708539 RepID=UPI0013EB592A|nr:hypothetical protein [Caulobacter soli]
MHTSHFWQSAGLIAIIFGAAVLSAMIGSRAHAATADFHAMPVHSLGQAWSG